MVSSDICANRSTSNTTLIFLINGKKLTLADVYNSNTITNFRTPSLMGFGTFSGLMFLYFTDWKLFMDKVPFYNKKFEEKEPLV